MGRGELQSVHKVPLLTSLALSRKAFLSLPPVQPTYGSFSSPSKLESSPGLPVASPPAFLLNLLLGELSHFHFCLSSILPSSYRLLQDLDESPYSFCLRTDFLIFFPWLLCGPKTSSNHSVRLINIIDSALPLQLSLSLSSPELSFSQHPSCSFRSGQLCQPFPQ